MKKTNWKKQVDEILRKKHTVPDGWETKEQVAESLECSPDRVHALLKPGLDEGIFERAEFSVWNENRRMTERVTCYREASSVPVASSPNTMDERIKSSILKNPHHEDWKIAKNIRGVKSKDVERIRKSLNQ